MTKTASEMTMAEIVAELRRRNELQPVGDNFLLDLANRLADEPKGDSREAALQDIAYRNGAQQALVIAHQSLPAADKWLADLWTRNREARAVLSSYWQCPCCENYYTTERLVCPVSGDSRPENRDGVEK